jgi:hypothetical protein
VNEDFFDEEDRAFVSLRFAGQIEWQITNSLRVGESGEIYPSLKKFRNFTSR